MEAVTGRARKVALTLGQNASSGLDLFNELTCSCWQPQLKHLLESWEQTQGTLRLVMTTATK